jgi:hypothetical protein
MLKVSRESVLVVLSLLSTANVSDAQAQGPDLSMLGEPSWNRFRPGWSLTVNDQCMYEFVFEFEHDETLPMGTQNFENKCSFKDPKTKDPFLADDGEPYLGGRKHWERFPAYVWATMGFNHLSVDWYACGHQPRGFSLPHYDFSFFRVTPEFRAFMTCDLLVDEQLVVPGEEVCAFQQETVEGMNFFVVPGALVNRNPVVNMPASFTRPKSGNGPVPHVGLRSWDQETVPATPNRWKDLALVMSSYAGDLVMWQAHVPLEKISGDVDQFTSAAARYHETTVQTLPDTYAFDYDVKDGKVRLHMIGKSQLCRQDFENAQSVVGGVPVFPDYDYLLGIINGDWEDGENGEGDGNSGVSGRPAINFWSLTMTFGLLYWIRW